MSSNTESKRHALTVTGPTRAVAKRVAELRRDRGWTAADLAQRCEAIGAPMLNRTTISNIESGRRKYIDISEVLTLAYALEVAPLHLIVPVAPDPDSDRHLMSVTADRFMSLKQLRQWVRGLWSPSDVDPVRYFGSVPAEERDEQRLGELESESDTLQKHRELTAQLLPHEAHPDALRRHEVMDEEASARVEETITSARDFGNQPERVVRVVQDDTGWRVVKPGVKPSRRRFETEKAAVNHAAQDAVRHSRRGQVQIEAVGKRPKRIEIVDGSGLSSRHEDPVVEG